MRRRLGAAAPAAASAPAAAAPAAAAPTLVIHQHHESISKTLEETIDESLVPILAPKVCCALACVCLHDCKRWSSAAFLHHGRALVFTKTHVLGKLGVTLGCAGPQVGTFRRGKYAAGKRVGKGNCANEVCMVLMCVYVCVLCIYTATGAFVQPDKGGEGGRVPQNQIIRAGIKHAVRSHLRQCQGQCQLRLQLRQIADVL